MRSEKELVGGSEDSGASLCSVFRLYHVGAALRLSDGKIVQGRIRKMCLSIGTLCRARTALFTLGLSFRMLQFWTAVVARGDGSQASSIARVGDAGGDMESASRRGTPFRVLLAGPEEVTIIDDCRDLLPIGFDASAL